MKTFTGKNIWITGASSGIGEALAYKFAAEASYLVLSGRNQEKLKQVKDNCREKGATVMIFAFDLKDENLIPGIVKNIIEQTGQIDLLINNGGVSQRSLVTETPFRIDKQIMDTNFFGNINITKSLLPYMLKNGSGHIVVTTSIVGKFGFPLRSVYSASKHALYGFYESLRLELLKKNIKVSMICPGRINTDISMNAVNSEGDKHNKMDAGQQNGILANRAADIIYRGLCKEKREILVGGKEILMIYIKMLFPGLFYRIAGRRKYT